MDNSYMTTNKNNGYLQVDPYHSNQFNQAQSYERNMISRSVNNSRDAVNTNIIPRDGFNQRIMNEKNSHFDFEPNQQSFISPLSGQVMKVEEFTHNNMQPFFGGSVRQNTLENANDTILENFTGNSTVYKEKTEMKGMFDMERDMGNVNGTPSFNSDDIRSRYIPSQMRQNELPTTQVRVGPGLNQGYGWKPSGGLTQPNTRDFIMPKDTNDLRTLDNPKLSYKGRLIMGQKEKQRAVVVAPKKNRVETYYKNTPDRYFKTTGAFTKEKIRSECYVKPTHRKNTRAYMGSAAPNTFTKPYQVPAIKKSTRHNYKFPGWRNADGKTQWKFKEEDANAGIGDYGKNAVEVKPQERDVTQIRRHYTNVKSVVSSIVMPILDMMRETRKENFVGNNRPDGVMKAAMPSKMTVHDPNDIMRTTIKETTIDNDYVGIVDAAMPSKPTVHDPNDVMRTTIKETTIDNNYIGIVDAAMPSKLTVYDPNDILRTTIKETTIDNSHIGFYGITTASKQTVQDPNDILRTTIKETTIENLAPHINLSAPKALTVYDPNDVMRTTVKETTIDNDHTGHIQGVERVGKGYVIANMNPKTTQKQFLSDHYYQGHADAQSGTGNGRGYLVANVEAKTTQKQFLSNYEYQGHASHATTKAPTSYASDYNARITSKKDIVAKGRTPTNSSVKLAAGSDMINHYNKKIEADVINVREPYEDKLYSIPPQQNQCGLTTMKDKLSEDVNRERINPDNLKAFQENPYTQPLNSVFPY
jgi:hypothetical protein